MPILGIIASQDYNRVTNSYESIATVTVGSPVATVSFSSIPATYTHLQVRLIAKSTETLYDQSDAINFYFNADTTYTNYRSHWLRGDGSSATSSQIQLAGYNIYTGTIASGHSSQTSMFGAQIIDILDYANTNKYKTVRTLGGDDLNSANGIIGFHSGLWMSTSAITGLTFNVTNASNFAQYSQFALYGIKGA
jgi:hypothetical protein